MFSAMAALLSAVNTVTPLGVAVLLALVLLKQTQHTKQINEMRGNDLHELPDILETLQRMERDQAAGFATVIEALRRMNGH